MNGTNDPLIPYNGGEIFVAGPSRGTVRSAQASAEYFAKLNGPVNPPKTTRLPHQDPSDPTFVDRTVWNGAGKPEVILDTISEGGHVVPQSKYVVSPSTYGRTTKDLDGPVEIRDLFSRQQSLKCKCSWDYASIFVLREKGGSASSIIQLPISNI